MSVLDRANNSPEVLRARRKKVFKAFDIYKENVNYGLITETAEQHDRIVEWYEACLNLMKEALFNVPSEVAKYL